MSLMNVSRVSFGDHPFLAPAVPASWCPKCDGAHSAWGMGPSISRWNDRSDREINIGYRCVTARRSIVLIGQSDFSGAGRSKDRRNDLACNALVAGAHSHHSDEVHFECIIFHGEANSPHPNTAVAHLIPWSHEPVPRFTCPDIGGINRS